jgi:hypothetical protein
MSQTSLVPRHPIPENVQLKTFVDLRMKMIAVTPYDHHQKMVYGSEILIESITGIAGVSRVIAQPAHTMSTKTPHAQKMWC